MKRHLVSYDLSMPTRDYARLHAELERLGGRRVLLSQWVLRSNAAAAQLRDHLRQFMDADDRILVTALNEEWASYGALTDLNAA